jgi:hypothetical protein
MRAGWRRLGSRVGAACLLLALAGCAPWRDEGSVSSVSGEWRELLTELRAFERRLGFRPTKNFARLAEEREGYAFCGHAPLDVLPYSYEDPVVRWYESITEEECRSSADGRDWYFEVVEAQGEVGTPVTASMLTGTLDRFIYLVIHEDCHDQFDLPYGIEEPLCNIITYRAMTAFAAEKYQWYTHRNRAIRNYAHLQSREARTVVVHYGELEALYQRLRGGEVTLPALLTTRAALLRRAEHALDLPAGNLNNIKMASYMTYSRHHGALEAVVDRFGADLAAAVAFFRTVDARKPTPEQLLQRHGISDKKSLAFVRASEQAILDGAAAALALRTAALARD